MKEVIILHKFTLSICGKSSGGLKNPQKTKKIKNNDSRKPELFAHLQSHKSDSIMFCAQLSYPPSVKLKAYGQTSCRNTWVENVHDNNDEFLDINSWVKGPFEDAFKFLIRKIK